MTKNNNRERRLNPGNMLLNLAIVLLAAIVVFLLYSFVNTTMVNTPVDNQADSRGMTASGEVIQLDVLNGCGVQGVAQDFTDFLRKRKFDVVQSSNYTSFDVVESLVIDRVGNKATASKVAHALGIDVKNVVTQINPDYYLHVSVVIGRDYQELKPYK